MHEVDIVTDTCVLPEETGPTNSVHSPLYNPPPNNVSRLYLAIIIRKIVDCLPLTCCNQYEEL
jgi:hypothetical protein